LAGTPAILLSEDLATQLGQKNDWDAHLIGLVQPARLQDVLIEVILKKHSKRRLSFSQSLKRRLLDNQLKMTHATPISDSLNPNSVNLSQPLSPRPRLRGRDGSGKDLRILVVDHQQPNRHVLLWLLKKLGYEHIESASSGFELLGNLDTRNYDVIFLDLNMPSMSGLESALLIQGHWPEKKIHIIGCSALSNSYSESECVSAGMSGFISKPVIFNALYNVMSKIDLNLPPLGEFSPLLQNRDLKTRENEYFLAQQQKLKTIPEEDLDDVALRKFENPNILKKTQLIPPAELPPSFLQNIKIIVLNKYIMISFICFIWALGVLYQQ